MTRDDIINMAKEIWGLEYVSAFDVPKLERFAALVAESEREACAVVMEAQPTWITNVAASALIRARTTP